MGTFLILMTNIHLVGVFTAMHGTDFISQAEAEAEAEADQFYQKHAIPPVGLPREVAALTAFLASNEAIYGTGAEFIAESG
jgi:3alpha(or 20beta)-hydroxysteroid dehydrogenase